MSNSVFEAAHEMRFCGNYLVQSGAIFHWCEDEGTQSYMLKEMLRFADRVAAAAEIIRKEIDNGSAE